jgi:omega-amidase
VCGSVPERAVDGANPANCLVLAAPDGTAHRYRKLHPFTYSGEHERYSAGDQFVTVDVEGVRVSLFVCYDLRFADEFWQLAQDTHCYVIPANWPEPRRDHWRTLLRARAIENLAYVIGANRVGEGGGVHYVGDSAVIGPFGEELASGEGAGETILYADVDPARVASTRARYPFLADRRD